MPKQEMDQMEKDTALAVQINQQGSYEQAEREAQAANIALNVARWRQEQERKALKRQHDLAEAQRRGLSLSQLKQYRREQYNLRHCRNTLQQLAEYHAQQKKGAQEK